MRIRVPRIVEELLSSESAISELEEILSRVEELLASPAIGRLEVVNTSLPADVVRIVALTLAAVKNPLKLFQPLEEEQWVTTFFKVVALPLEELLPKVEGQKEFLWETDEGHYILNLPPEENVTLYVLDVKEISKLYTANLPYEKYKLVSLFTYPIKFTEGHIQSASPFIFPSEYLLVPKEWYARREYFASPQSSLTPTARDYALLEYYLLSKDSLPFSPTVVETLYSLSRVGKEKLIREEAVLALELQTMCDGFLELPLDVYEELWGTLPTRRSITYKLFHGKEILVFPSGLIVPCSRLRPFRVVFDELKKIYKANPHLLRASLPYKDFLTPLVGVPGSFAAQIRKEV